MLRRYVGAFVSLKTKAVQLVRIVSQFLHTGDNLKNNCSSTTSKSQQR